VLLGTPTGAWWLRQVSDDDIRASARQGTARTVVVSPSLNIFDFCAIWSSAYMSKRAEFFFSM